MALKGCLMASIIFFSLCGQSFAQDIIKASNSMIARLELRQPEVCRKVAERGEREKKECELLFADTVSAIRNAAARLTQGDRKGYRGWFEIYERRLAVLLQRYGHITVSASAGQSQ